ncbi:hypothetical protein [Tsukamurella sp. PLM1]|uniref:hypothetical protein n=1 Tax=Tsukamurella sp. PLM1 TaxID=2929795 RepID=UPI002064288F|nr:hypothetical protein [Tsukamurella sp. PLM1]BDH55549.1 hypothetical protein MTP03_04880 [Tsukamurella sp. PLM1]
MTTDRVANFEFMLGEARKGFILSNNGLPDQVDFVLCDLAAAKTPATRAALVAKARAAFEALYG